MKRSKTPSNLLDSDSKNHSKDRCSSYSYRDALQVLTTWAGDPVTDLYSSLSKVYFSYFNL